MTFFYVRHSSPKSPSLNTTDICSALPSSLSFFLFLLKKYKGKIKKKHGTNKAENKRDEGFKLASQCVACRSIEQHASKATYDYSQVSETRVRVRVRECEIQRRVGRAQDTFQCCLSVLCCLE